MITIDDLVHRIDGEAVLDGVSLTFESGEWTAIVGPNGSGKTTLLRHLNGLLAPDEGRIRVDGLDPQREHAAVRQRVGLVFQEPRDGFVAATVEADVAFGPENLGLTHDEIERRVTAALSVVAMADRRDDRVDEVSAGEAARVAIAGVLAMEPAVLLLDEPFARLDWPARRTLLTHLDELSTQGLTILQVTHDLRDLLDRVDRIVGVVDGRVAVAGSPDEVRPDLESIGVRDPVC